MLNNITFIVPKVPKFLNELSSVLVLIILIYKFLRASQKLTTGLKHLFVLYVQYAIAGIEQ